MTRTNPGHPPRALSGSSSVNVGAPVPTGSCEAQIACELRAARCTLRARPGFLKNCERENHFTEISCQTFLTELEEEKTNRMLPTHFSMLPRSPPMAHFLPSHFLLGCKVLDSPWTLRCARALSTSHNTFSNTRHRLLPIASSNDGRPLTTRAGGPSLYTGPELVVPLQDCIDARIVFAAAPSMGHHQVRRECHVT